MARVLIAIGLGFLSFFIGALILPELPSPAFVSEGGTVAIVFDTVVRQLWVWAVMPALLYVVARVLELRLWGVPVGSAVAGTFFLLALEWLIQGAALLVAYPERTVTIVLTAAAGAVLGRMAVRSARSAADERQKEADAAASARRSEYDEFAREAERLAALHERRATSSEGAASESSMEEAPPPPAPRAAER